MRIFRDRVVADEESEEKPVEPKSVMCKKCRVMFVPIHAFQTFINIWARAEGVFNAGKILSEPDGVTYCPRCYVEVKAEYDILLWAAAHLEAVEQLWDATDKKVGQG